MTASSHALFSQPVGGYRRLDSFVLATIIQVETWRFCQSFLDIRNDPKGRWFDQMTQAARSGRANLIEGSENAATSKETELRLLGVARASFAELLGDYEMWLAYADRLPWSKDEAREVLGMPLDAMPPGDDILRDSAVHARAQRAKFARWLDSDDSFIRANCLLALTRRAIQTIRRQIQALGDSFVKTGGLREQMTAARLEARVHRQPATSAAESPPPPECPICGMPMRKRTRRETGEPFWGCSAYSAGCRGTRPFP